MSRSVEKTRGSGRYSDIPGHEGYEINEQGVIRGKPRYVDMRGGKRLVPGRIMKQTKNNRGYPMVCLSKGNRVKLCTVHRLVLLTFVGNPKEGQEACHTDGDRSNPHLSNLTWDSRKSNNLDKKQHGTYLLGEKTGTAKLTELDVLNIKKQLANGVSNKLIAQQYPHIHERTISDIKCRKSWGWIDAKRT